jgi:hypothetical protein
MNLKFAVSDVFPMKPDGFMAISRWLRSFATTPPVLETRKLHPGRAARCGAFCDPSGIEYRGAFSRGGARASLIPG